MNGALIRKELRELRPWAVMALVIWCIDLFEALTERAPDLHPLGEESLLHPEVVELDPLLAPPSHGAKALAIASFEPRR